MKYSCRLFAASVALLLPVTASRLDVRDTSATSQDDPNVAKVCYPEVKDGDTIPPCISITEIETECQPKGTDPSDYGDHAQCMCKGSYFMDWRGCQKCLLDHGFRSPRDNAFWEQVVSVASKALCQPSPTAPFQSIFASVQANTKEAPPVTTGETTTSDKFPGQTDVSLYYLASAPQGPGVRLGVQTGTAASAKTTGAAGSNSTTPSLGKPSNAQPTAGSGQASNARPGMTPSTSTGGVASRETGFAVAAIAGAALVMAL